MQTERDETEKCSDRDEMIANLKEHFEELKTTVRTLMRAKRERQHGPEERSIPDPRETKEEPKRAFTEMQSRLRLPVKKEELDKEIWSDEETSNTTLLAEQSVARSHPTSLLYVPVTVCRKII